MAVKKSKGSATKDPVDSVDDRPEVGGSPLPEEDTMNGDELDAEFSSPETGGGLAPQSSEVSVGEMFDKDDSFFSDGLTEDEVGDVPIQIEVSPHPFDGYRLGRGVVIRDHKGKELKDSPKVPTTYLVILRDQEVFQDPSGRGVVINKEVKDDQGRVIDRIPRVVNLITFHSRCVVDPWSKEHREVVFDRTVRVQGKDTPCAVVPNPVDRAQLYFFINNKGKVRADQRYRVADPRQIDLLRDVFVRVNHQQTRSERMSDNFYKEAESAGRRGDGTYDGNI